MKKFSVVFLFTFLKLNAQWIEAGGINALSDYSEVHSISNDKAGNVYVSGYHTSPPENGPYVSVWDGQLWKKLKGADTDHLGEICTDENGVLYAVTSTPIRRVLKWDGNSWANLGGPITGQDLPLQEIHADSYGNLYVASIYTNGSPFIARWNSSSNWAALSTFTGLSPPYKSITSLCSDKAGKVYATGGFTNSAGNYYVARWTASGWEELGGPNGLAANNLIISIHVDSYGNLFAGGFFTNSGGNYFVAKWNGVSWSQEVELASVFSYPGSHGIYDLCSDGAEHLYIGGRLQSKSANENITFKWNGAELLELYGGSASHTGVEAMCTDLSGNLYAVGTKQGYPNNFVAMYPNAKLVGIKEQHADNNNINIFPNPASDKITVKVNVGNLGNELMSVKIRDVLGKVIYEKGSLPRESTIDVSSYTPGVYLISVNAGGQWHTSKVLKE